MTTVGIVGAGTMGAGIAQVVLAAGDEVLLHDVDPLAIERARDRIAAGLERHPPAVGSAAEALGRLRESVTLDALGAEAEVVIEAAIEDLELKRTIVRALDAAAAPSTLIATNTSALSVAAIAAAAGRPGRVLGLHWFNPVPRMALVEVVDHPTVDGEALAHAMRLVTGWGKTPVACHDTPGFIVNRVNRPFTIAALRLLETRAASVAVIDRALRDAGFPVGPFELMDLVGLDVNLAAATAVWEGLGRPERLRPSAIQARLVRAGHLGRKAGVGFYRYEDGRAVGPDGPFADASSPALQDAAIAGLVINAIDDEARRTVADGVAEPDAIDLALRLGANHPVGPFERRSVTRLRGSTAGS
ncbi:MAG: 3-hydroxyacyl-CoA dehydrogenase NAD-binding domain-containing protein [Chloroflexota bacterium]